MRFVSWTALPPSSVERMHTACLTTENISFPYGSLRSLPPFALGPQRALVEDTTLEGVPLHLGTGLPLHNLNILLEGHLLDV